jgi:flagellar protein FlaG
MDVSQVSFDRIGQVTAAYQAEAQTRNQAREETRQVAAAVQQLNKTDFTGASRELTIILDPETRRPLVRIIDKQTGDVLRQIPSEYVVRLAQEAHEQQRAGVGA